MSHLSFAQRFRCMLKFDLSSQIYVIFSILVLNKTLCPNNLLLNAKFYLSIKYSHFYVRVTFQLTLKIFKI